VCELWRRQVWFASGNISGQFSKQPAFEGHSSQQQQPVLFLFDKPTPSAPHSISLQMTTVTMMAMTATMTMMTSRGRWLRVQHVSVNPLVACTGGCCSKSMCDESVMSRIRFETKRCMEAFIGEYGLCWVGYFTPDHGTQGLECFCRASSPGMLRGTKRMPIMRFCWKGGIPCIMKGNMLKGIIPAGLYMG